MYFQRILRREPISARATSRRVPIYLSAIAILVVVSLMWIFAGPSLRKPFVMDEMEFPAVARAITETGRPNYYRGETNRSNLGLWHPPLYILTLAAWQVIFGSSVLSNRVYGLSNACLALVLIGIFVVRRWGWHGSWRQDLALLPVLLIGLAAAATAPLYIQGAILPDIDTQVLPLLVTAMFLLLFELRRRANNWIYWAGFVVALTVLFFAKLTTPVLLVPAFVAFEVIRNLAGPSLQSRVRAGPRHQVNGLSGEHSSRYRILITFNRAGLNSLATAFLPIMAGAISFALMAAIWFIMAQVWGVSFSLPFIYLTQSTNNPASLGGSAQAILAAIIASLPSHFRYFTQWVGYPALLLITLMIVREFLRPTDGILFVWERAALYTFLILLVCMYTVLKPAPFDFPKYYPPLIPPIALLVADVLAALHKKKRLIFAGIVLILEIILYVLYIAASSTLSVQDFIYQVYFSAPDLPVFLRWMLVPLAFVMIGNTVIWLFARHIFGVPLITAAIAVALGWQITTAARQMVVPYATTYLYGEQSLNNAVSYLRTNLPGKAVVIAPKDIGFMLQDRWRYIELDVDPRRYFTAPEVKYLVFRSNDYYGHTIQETPEVATAIQQQFELITTIDNFTVMRRNNL